MNLSNTNDQIQNGKLNPNKQENNQVHSVNRENHKARVQLTLKKIDQLSFPLDSLQKRNKDPNYINYKLYHLLCNPYTYINVYSKIIKNKGSTKRYPRRRSNFQVLRQKGSTSYCKYI